MRIMKSNDASSASQQGSLILNLKSRRNRLAAPYTGFVFMFGSSCAFASTGPESSTLVALFGVLLLLTIPIIVLNVLLHKAIRCVSPTAGSSGAKQSIISAILFTPFEAALVLPAINLYIASKILRVRALTPDHKRRYG